MKRAREIRQKFLDYFAGQGHQVVPSASLIPQGDPTLFFVNAGMVPFKNVFIGEETRAYTRAASSQKCLRVQGKHNDLEEVGRTPRHHTFFEMLGNFSFGDYFKKEAVDFGWELLTKEYGIPADRLIATVFEKDEEAAKIWEAHLPRERIFRFGEKDNFWAMGETGPCGPCSELHYDWAPEKGAPTQADVESHRFWEIWNLVFMQYNRDAKGKMEPLSKPSIDTGMGLERLTAILQGKTSNYETDLFTPIITAIEKITQKKHGGKGEKSDVSIQVIADHIRATAFLIADGVLPNNEGRGYVLRRIMRRAIRHGKMLGQEEPFFYRVLPSLVDEMGPAFPELVQHRPFIEEVIRNEETRFYKTLANGLAILTDAFAGLRKTKTKQVPGDIAFKLCDTYGFPMDLTEDIAEEYGFTVDHAGFEKCMAGQREQARSAWKGAGAAKVAEVYQQLQQQEISSEFTGYSEESGEARVLALVREGKAVKKAGAGDEIEIVVDRTPFYGESGGQIGDTGSIVTEELEIAVTDTQKPVPGLIAHCGKVVRGKVKVGDTVTLAVDSDRRDQIRKHHTATHLMHKALRETLGEHVKQAGSLVAPDRLRFDFSHFAAVTPEQIEEIETDVNRVIQHNIPLVIVHKPREEAIAGGAMAFFGEKYGDMVRVIDIPGYSTELCGGIHVKATGDIGAFKIVSESSVASGVRRIEALTGRALVNYLQAMESERRHLAALLKVGPQEISNKVQRLTEQVKELERKLRAAKTSAAGESDLMSQVQEVGGVKVLASTVDDVDVKALREIGDRYRQKLGSGVLALGTVHEGKASAIVMVSKDLTKQFQAGKLIRHITDALGGKGGGRPDMAQGGGPNVDALAEAIKTFPSAL